MKSLGTEKIIFAIVGGLTLLTVIFIVIFSVNEGKQAKSQSSITYSKSDKDRPKLSFASPFSILAK